MHEVFLALHGFVMKNGAVMVIGGVGVVRVVLWAVRLCCPNARVLQDMGFHLENMLS